MPATEPVRLAGWSCSISGETIEYHSSYPSVRRALLSRAVGWRMAIAWRTAPCSDAGLPTPDPRCREPGCTSAESSDELANSPVSFLWLAGLATGKGAHRFTLTVDGLKDGVAEVDFRTDGVRDWEVTGSAGARLAFTTTFIDQFAELFGIMSLTLPTAAVIPGVPLDLRVIGEDAHSDDWFMVFEHEISDWVFAEAEQALLRSAEGSCQPVRVEISRLGDPTDVVISVSGAADLAARVATGFNEFRIAVPAVGSPVSTAIVVKFADGTPDVFLTAEQQPVHMREVWLLPHPHLDIGYTEHQDEVERHHWAHLEQALDLARRTSGYPEEARSRWNVEQLWAVESWWNRASPMQREMLAEAVREGSIGLQAMLAGVLTGICHPDELRHLTDFSRELSGEMGIVIDTAMITDIPGQTWGLVSALSEAGVRYLSSGPNYMPSLPDGGDRIGRILKAWGDRPVWWESQSGEERVLLWIAGRGYSWFHGLNGGTIDPDRPRPLMEYMAELLDAGYQYDLVQVRYTIGGDNGPPDPELPARVAAWNERYASPRLRIATAGVMFHEMERRHGESIPTVRGDLTPYWEDGAASSAAETAMKRNSANRLVQAEAIWRNHGATPLPCAEFTAAWRQVVLFSEHTWGAAESVSEPDSPHVRAQWEYKQSLALAGDRASRGLLDRAMDAAGGSPFRHAPGPRPRHRRDSHTVTVFNTLDWPRSDVVIVPAHVSSAGDRVVDLEGRPTPSQRLGGGELAFHAANVPGQDLRRYLVVPGDALPSASNTAACAGGLVIENEHMAVAVDPTTGAVSSLIWLPRGVEMVDREKWPGLNAYVYVPGRDPELAVGIDGGGGVAGVDGSVDFAGGGAAITVLECGPLVASLRIESTAPGARSLRRELRLTAGSDRLEIMNVIDKIAVREKESVHIAFPFRIPGGRVRLDLGGVVIRPDVDQLAGSCRDWFCVHSGVEVANDEFGVIWVTRDAPLVEIGALTDETPRDGGRREWRREVGDGQTVFSYAMNNYWHTNYRADQEGPVTLRYTIRPSMAGSRGLIECGRSDVQPLAVAWRAPSE